MRAKGDTGFTIGDDCGPEGITPPPTRGEARMLARMLTPYIAMGYCPGTLSGGPMFTDEEWIILRRNIAKAQDRGGRGVWAAMGEAPKSNVTGAIQALLQDSLVLDSAGLRIGSIEDRDKPVVEWFTNERGGLPTEPGD